METKTVDNRSRHRSKVLSVRKRSGINLFSRRKENREMDDTRALLEDADEEAYNDTEHCCPTRSWLSICMMFLYTCLYITLYLIALHFEFGMVYLVVSAIFLIYWNTRTGPKKQDELSAYSVFNPNCERIDGTFTAEQLEREMFYGPAAAAISR